jgi:hypothetical protein
MDEVSTLLARIDGAELDVVLWPEPPADPIGAPDRFQTQIGEALDAGATMINLRFASRSLAHHLEQMEVAISLGP